MKLLSLLVICFTSITFAKACSLIDAILYQCKDDPDKRIAVSDMTQLSCTGNPSPPNPDAFDMEFEENGKMFKCHKIGQEDTNFEHSAIYPAAPPKPPNSPLSFSYSRIGGNPEHVVNCIIPWNEMDEIIFSVSKGFFPVVDVKKNVKYLCTHATDKFETLMERVGRAFSRSC